MLSFRQKIFLSYLAIFLIFIAISYPIVTWLIKNTQERDLKRQTKDLVEELQKEPSLDLMLKSLQELEKHSFFQITLIDPKTGILFDTHQQSKNGVQKEEWPEIAHVMAKEEKYEIRYSPRFGQDMAYFAISFPFQQKTLILRTGFPFGQINHLAKGLTFTFLIFIVILLLLFGLLAWIIFHYLTLPAKQIIAAISPYQRGLTEKIPTITLPHRNRGGDEFNLLAETLNSLSKKIEDHIAWLTEEKNDKEAILESLGEGVIAIDGSMNIRFINHIAEAILNVKKEDVIGKKFAYLKQPKCQELLRSSQYNKMPMTAVISLEGKRKSYFDAMAVPRGKTEGAILVLQDKTSLHKVLELGRDFIANASHELKTPITIIRGFAETLHDHPELSREVSIEITKKIVTNCQRMETLVKNLLTLAAIDERIPRSRMQICDLMDLAAQARMTILAVHPEAEITIEQVGNEPVDLPADSDLLYQAVLNLLDNAVKYSRPPSKVMVNLEKREKEVTIKVSDKGIGIPQDDLEKIFERFYAVDKSYSRSLGGSGLGLSIVERIIEKHRGSISVESELGKGTTFTIILPVFKEE